MSIATPRTEVVVESVHMGMPDCLATVNQGESRVPLFNPSDDPWMVEEGQPIGVVKPLEKIEDITTQRISFMELRDPEKRKGVDMRVESLRSSMCKKACSSCLGYAAAATCLEPQVISDLQRERFIKLETRRKRLENELGKIDVSNIPEHLRDMYLYTLTKYEDVLTVDESEVGKSTVLPQALEIGISDYIPRKADAAVHSLPDELKWVVEDYVEWLRDAGII